MQFSHQKTPKTANSQRFLRQISSRQIVICHHPLLNDLNYKCSLLYSKYLGNLDYDNLFSNKARL